MEDITTSTQTSATPHYAGFWRRFAAYIIDASILHILFAPLILLYLKNSGLWDIIVTINHMPKGASQIASLIDPEGYIILMQTISREIIRLGLFEAGILTVYFAIWESSKFQATPGKLAVGIHVTDSAGQRVSFLRALGRNISKIVSSALFLIGYIMAGFTERKQALHDMIANCVVTSTQTVTEPIATLEYAGFWRRFIAWVLDFILLLILLSPINYVFFPPSFNAYFQKVAEGKQPELPPINDLILAFSLIAVTTLITYFYYASWESSRYQGTPGKLAIGIKVTDLNGQRLSYWKASARYAARQVTNLTLLIGYIMAGITKHSQALHDKLSNCLVIKGNN